MKPATQILIGLISVVGYLFVRGLHQALKDIVFGFCNKYFWAIVAVIAASAYLENNGWSPIIFALSVIGKVLAAIFIFMIFASGSVAIVMHIMERRKVAIIAKSDLDK